MTAQLSSIPATLPAPATCSAGPLSGLRARWDAVASELGKFLAVGGAAFVVDMLTFNLLRQAGSSSVAAKALSTVIATFVAYLGNRYWSFSHRAGDHIRNETAIFFALNGVGLVISLTCVWFSHHLMGFTSGLADNLAALVGIALGTLFRFWSYRRFVFTNTQPASDTHSVSELIPGSIIATHPLAGVTALPSLTSMSVRYDSPLYADEAVA